MRGLLADVNIQGHLRYLCQLIQAIGVMTVLEDMQLHFATFPDLGLPQRSFPGLAFPFLPEARVYAKGTGCNASERVSR